MGVVTVHVFDDAPDAPQQARHDYRCEVKLLVKHMHYFKPFLQDLPGQDVEISVKCNLQTFDWLMAYVKAGITGVQPVLDYSNCIPILIACSFLKMAQLVREAVAFIAHNILELAALGAGIASLDGSLITKIAKATSEEALEALLQNCQQVQLPHLPGLQGSSSTSTAASTTNPSSSSSSSNASSHILLQKLYKHKLEALLKEHQTTLLRCQQCQQLFSASSHKKLQCAALAGAATERLKVLPLHQPDPSWRFQDFLQQQRRPEQQQQQQQQQSLNHKPQQQQQVLGGPVDPKPWRDLYWLTWGHVMVLYCQQCHQHFPARQYSHCSYHPMTAVFASEAAAGVYPCCGRPAWQPGMPLAHSQGCSATQHQAAVQQLQGLVQQQRLKVQGKQQQQQQQKQLEIEQQVDTGQDAAARALQLLQRFGGVITEPYVQPTYSPPPLPPKPVQAPAASLAAAAAAAAAGSDCGSSRNSSRCPSTSSSRPSSRGATSLPLLVRMTNRTAAGAAAAGAAGASPRQQHATPGSSTSTAASPRSARSAAAAAAAAAEPLVAGATAPGSAALMPCHGLSDENDRECDQELQDELESEDDAEEAADDEHSLDYRSAHLRCFLDAVRAAAQSRNRGSSMLGVGSMSAARMQAEVGVPLGATFSSGGSARPFGRQSLVGASRAPAHNQSSSSSSSAARPGSRQQPLAATPGPGALLPSSSSSRPLAAAARLVGGSSHAGSSSNSRPLPMAAAAAAAADVQASKVNRTLLLELMHEDDMYRMGLLMCKLDSVRLQPPPEGSSQPLSAEQVTQAVNGTLFKGRPLDRAATARHRRAGGRSGSAAGH